MLKFTLNTWCLTDYNKHMTNIALLTTVQQRSPR